MKQIPSALNLPVPWQTQMCIWIILFIYLFIYDLIELWNPTPMSETLITCYLALRASEDLTCWMWKSSNRKCHCFASVHCSEKPSILVSFSDAYKYYAEKTKILLFFSLFSLWCHHQRMEKEEEPVSWNASSRITFAIASSLFLSEDIHCHENYKEYWLHYL